MEIPQSCLAEEGLVSLEQQLPNLALSMVDLQKDGTLPWGLSAQQLWL